MSKKQITIFLIILSLFFICLKTQQQFLYEQNYIKLQDAPLPKCKTNFFYKTLPLITNQGYILNLDNVISGYNISFSIQGADQYQDSLTMKEKIKFLKKEVPDQQLLGLKNYHLQKKNNVWGKSFIALTSRNEKSYINFGVLNSNDTAPVINNAVVVQNYTNTTCFDAVIFPQKDLILVDCMYKLDKPNSKNQIFQNVFYYRRLSDGSDQGFVKTQMYINFQKITYRKLEIYSDLLSTHTFLIRTYYSDYVDEKYSGNTYSDIFMISDPRNPWIVQIIDRSFFGINSLKISDIKIYLGQIYILDKDKGVFRVKITTQQDLQFMGFYEAKGFTKFTVYSNNLDDSFQLALANQHSVYQIDWSQIKAPKLLNKYSLMPDSNILQVFLNNRFLIIHSLNQINSSYYNYTWIFNRGSRTYTNAFLTISHNTSQTFVEYNEGLSNLIVIDSYQLANYKIDNANLIIRVKDDIFLDRMMHFTIKGQSKQQLAPKIYQQIFNYRPQYYQKLIQDSICNMMINFTLLLENNRTMWPIGLQPPSNYVVNYPGKIVIPLYQYVLGPNITYSIKQKQQGQIKKSKIYQNQQLIIKWDKPLPSTIKPIFLKTETVIQQSGDVMYLYMQDQFNITYITYCLPKHQDLDVYCNQTIKQDVAGRLTNWVSTLFFSQYTFKYHHLVGYTIQTHSNRVYLLDLGTRKIIQEVVLGSGFAGLITSIQMTGKYMFITLKYVKTVQVYDLQLCLEGLCQPIYTITHKKLYDLGVDYFSPRSIHTSKFHPTVVFIKSADKILALDIDKQGAPVLLSVLTPVSQELTQFSFRMNANVMIVVIQPNIIQEYDISRIFFKQITITKKYPMYGNKLPRGSSFDVSDYGNAVFVTTMNQADNRFVYVYRSGLPAVASLLNIVNLFTYSSTLIDVTGAAVDYITVFSEGQVRIYRQHQIPLAQVQSTQKDYQFFLQYSNSYAITRLQTISVQVINLPTNISVAPFLQNIMNTKDLLFSGQNRLSEINDSNWFTGNVLKIYPDCHDCKQNKVRVINHIQEQSKSQIAPYLIDYRWSPSGGTFQQMDNNIRMYHNGSIRNIVPLTDKQICTTLTIKEFSHYQVSACFTNYAITLQLVSTIAEDKPFAFQPYQTKAKNLYKISSSNQLIMLVDTTDNPFFKRQPGGIFIYAIDQDLDTDQALIQLDYFDGYEIGGDQKGFVYIVDADIKYYPATDIYRVYITDIVKGIFIIEFIYKKADKILIIKQINFIDLPRIISQKYKKMPYDATFQAIKLLSSKYDPNDRQYYQKILITTGLFHTFQIDLVYNLNAQIKSSLITKVYLRYSFYIISNDIKTQNQMFVVKQMLPLELDNGDYSKQLLTVYDTRGEFNGTIQERGMMGAFMSNQTDLRNFDFNLTFNFSDQHAQPRLGMVLVQYFNNHIVQLSLHRNLSVFTTQEVDTQIIFIDLFNDFSLKKIRILLNGKATYPEWITVAIILFSITGFLILLVIVFVLVRFIKNRRGGVMMDQQGQQGRGSLLTDNS